MDNDITPQQVTSFFRGNQGAGLKIPEVLGYRPQIIFLPLDEPLITEMLPPREKATKRPTSKVDHSKDPVNKRGLKINDREATKERLKKRIKKK